MDAFSPFQLPLRVSDQLSLARTFFLFLLNLPEVRKPQALLFTPRALVITSFPNRVLGRPPDVSPSETDIQFPPRPALAGCGNTCSFPTFRHDFFLAFFQKAAAFSRSRSGPWQSMTPFFPRISVFSPPSIDALPRHLSSCRSHRPFTWTHSYESGFFFSPFAIFFCAPKNRYSFRFSLAGPNPFIVRLFFHWTAPLKKFRALSYRRVAGLFVLPDSSSVVFFFESLLHTITPTPFPP